MKIEKKLDLTLLLCTFNEEKRIRNAIKNILDVLSDVDFKYEIIVIDNNSTDNSLGIVNTFDFEYELTFETQEDMRPAVFDFAHDNGLKILSLQQKNVGLEKRFNALTKGD